MSQAIFSAVAPRLSRRFNPRRPADRWWLPRRRTGGCWRRCRSTLAAGLPASRQQLRDFGAVRQDWKISQNTVPANCCEKNTIPSKKYYTYEQCFREYAGQPAEHSVRHRRILKPWCNDGGKIIWKNSLAALMEIFFHAIRWTRASKHGIYQPLVQFSFSFMWLLSLSSTTVVICQVFW